MNTVSGIVKNRIDGQAEVLAKILPTVDMKPEITDAQVKDALLNLTEAGRQTLYARFGKDATMKALAELSQGRRW